MDTLTFRALVALQQGPADGNELLDRIHGLDEAVAPSLPTLYRCLRTSLDAGWIEASAAKADPGRGRPPQIYRLTGDGTQALNGEAQRHQRLAALVLGAPGRGDR